MAKLKGALYSIAASGTVGGAVTYSRTYKTHLARSTPRRMPAPSAAQAAVRAQFTAAAAAWRALDAPTKAAWSALAATRGLPAFAKFWLEYRTQNTYPGWPPHLPMS